jgi:hypothetical protein
MKDINSLLKLFVSEKQNGTDWTDSPFRIEDKVYATDKHALLTIPSEFAPDVQPLHGYHPDSVTSVIPKAVGSIKTILTKDILAALKSVPTIKEDKNCEACKGEGEVEYEFEYEGKSYFSDIDCPICDGNGSFPDEDGKLIPDPDKCITIEMSKFSPKIVKKLYQLCKFFDYTEIDLVSQPDAMQPSLFAKQNISMLAMPLDDRESVHTIQ